jgi:hypothetical protein
MILTAHVKLDDDDRLFAEVIEITSNLPVETISADDDMRRTFREQLHAWAQANGHTFKSIDMGGLR